MSEKSEELRKAAQKAAQRLHHLSMRYSGAFMELLKGEHVSTISAAHPGLKEVRDFIDLILYTRAEINALTRLLIAERVLDIDAVQAAFAEEYEWLAQTKAKQLKVEVTDYGLSYKIGDEQHKPPSGN